MGSRPPAATIPNPGGMPMARTLMAVFLSALLASAVSGAPALAPAAVSALAEASPASRHVAVAFDGGAPEADVEAWLAARIAEGHAVTYRFRTFPAALLLPPAGKAGLVEALAGVAPVAAVSRGGEVELAAIPDDPEYPGQWWAANQGSFYGVRGEDLDLERAWDVATATGIIVAVIDRGFDVTHPDLAANLLPGRDFNDYWPGGPPDGYPGVPVHPHGTACAGVIGAVGDNGLGIAGVAWEIPILPLAFYTTIEAAAAIDYAVSAGARVISNSWGIGGAPDYFLSRAITAATAAGVVVVNAAGNQWRDLDAPGNQFYPASFNLPLNLAVGATASNGIYSGTSNYGPATVDIAAPGDKVLTCGLDGTYVTADGTSLAAPLVAGAIALLWAQQPAATPEWIVARILDRSEQLWQCGGKVAGGRRLNVFRALDDSDTAAPAAAGALHVAAYVEGGATIAWTAPGDDGMAGAVDHYEFWRTVPDASPVRMPDTRAPAAAGAPETFAVTGLSWGASTTVRVVAVDDARNRSVAQVDIVMPAAPRISLDQVFHVAGVVTGGAWQGATWVRNSGGASLEVSVTGGEASPWLAVDPAAFTVLPGDSCRVAFTARATRTCAAPAPALLQFTNNSGDPTVPQVGIFMQVTPASEIASVAGVDFGIVPPNGSAARQVLVENRGCVDLHVSGFGFADGARAATGAGALVVPPGGSTSVKVEFSAGAPGPWQDELRIASDCPATPVLAIPLRATVGDAGERTRELACWPNPFNARATFAFTAASDGPFVVAIHDARGRLVQALDGQARAGRQVEVEWGGVARDGATVPSGTYFAVLRLGGRQVGPALKVLLLQ